MKPDVFAEYAVAANAKALRADGRMAVRETKVRYRALC